MIDILINNDANKLFIAALNGDNQMRCDIQYVVLVHGRNITPNEQYVFVSNNTHFHTLTR